MHTAMYVRMTEPKDGQVPEARDSLVLFRSQVWRTACSDLHGVNQAVRPGRGLSNSTHGLLPSCPYQWLLVWCYDYPLSSPYGPRLPEGEAGMLLFNLRFLLATTTATTTTTLFAILTLFKAYSSATDSHLLGCKRIWKDAYSSSRFPRCLPTDRTLTGKTRLLLNQHPLFWVSRLRSKTCAAVGRWSCFSSSPGHVSDKSETDAGQRLKNRDRMLS
jgi:hypothetical protein